MKKFRVKHGMIRLNEKLRGFIYKGLKWFLLGSAVGFLSGSAATLFMVLLDKATQIRIAHPTLIIGLPVAGIILVLLFNLEESYRYVGLGIKVIQDSFSELLSWKDPLFKMLFTSLTVASGFKGGEFIPLVFIGSTLGSVLSQFIPAPNGLLAEVGFSSVFAATSNTPKSAEGF